MTLSLTIPAVMQLLYFILSGFFKGKTGEQYNLEKCLSPKLSGQFFTKDAGWVWMDKYLSMRPHAILGRDVCKVTTTCAHAM